jgi:hypothetical protein
MSNLGHLKNIMSSNATRVAVIGDSLDRFGLHAPWEISSGKDEAQAIARFYARYMHRSDIDREMIDKDQKRGALRLVSINGAVQTTIRNNLILVALAA